MAQSATPRNPFAVDAASELPVGLQLTWRLRALIASGRLPPGERLPSVRDLATWAGVNVNTVRAVYSRLEHDGQIATRHGAGTFVAERAAGSTEVERIAADAIAAAERDGVDARAVAEVMMVAADLPEEIDLEPVEPAVEEAPEIDVEELAAELELDDSWLDADERGARRELRRQIGRLEAQLAGYQRDLELLAPEPVPASGSPRIATAAELERTRDALLRRLAAARAAGAARARRERRAREVRDAIVADPKAHRWEVVSSDETGEPGCATWQVSPALGPLGVLANWWRVKVSGGCPLAAPPCGGLPS
jgi:DNA-binding transcriptional regulator YhcF (GntR family)